MLENKLNKYTKDELINIMTSYNDYVMLFYEDHEDFFNMTPVCIAEFIDNDYQEMLDAGFKNYVDWYYA